MSLERNSHWNVCLFIILFLLIWVYFYSKFVAFLCEKVHVFALNTVKMFCFKTLVNCKIFLFFSLYKQDKKIGQMLNLADINFKSPWVLYTKYVLMVFFQNFVAFI